MTARGGGGQNECTSGQALISEKEAPITSRAGGSSFGVGDGMYELIIAFDPIEEDHRAECRFRLSQFFDASFDFNFPFRPLIEFLAECVRQTGVPVEVSLPDYDKFEDFVEGFIRIDGSEVRIYFEHSLSFISFEAKTPDGLNRLLTASQGRRFQHKGYGLEDAKFSG